MALQVNLPTVANPTVRPQPPAGAASPLMHKIPAIVTQLAFTTQPGGASSGGLLSPQPVIAAQDSAGATVAGYSGSVTLALVGAGGTIGGTVTLSFVSGVATFTNITVAGAGTYQLRATSGSLPAATSTAFTITASGASTDWGTFAWGSIPW